MRELTQLEPKEVFSFFEDICAIPHGSGNTAAISDYLMDFARKRGLKRRRDERGNVIIWKAASPGREDRAPVMLQGHVDMVAVKKPDSDIDMEKESLRLAVEGDSLFARDTSLGGDDGIAVAYALAFLDSKELAHPPLECVFTVDEEIGLLGAAALDISDCRAHRMINLDSEEEGVFWVGCAGGMRLDCRLPLTVGGTRGTVRHIRIGGLLGGHSGTEIHRGRANSNVLAGRFLLFALEKTELRLVSVKGGLADNAIPRETLLQVVAEEELPGKGDAGKLGQAVREFDALIKEEYRTKDPGIYCRLEEGEAADSPAWAVSPADTQKAATLIAALPFGVQAYSGAMEGLVETSLNLGLLALPDQEAPLSAKGAKLYLGLSLRSSLAGAKYELQRRVTALTKALGGVTAASGDYPGWAYRSQSPLREKMAEVYERLYGEKPLLQAVHAGLECGFFIGKRPAMDCISMGPSMQDIHTTEEKLSISSTARTWDFLGRVLEEL